MRRYSNRRRGPSSKSFLLGMNPVVRFLTLSDVVILGSYQLLAPVFAVFVVERIDGANVAVAGLAISLYMIAKSVIQIPAASFMDKVKGEYDDFWILFWGSLAFSVIQIAYLFVQSPMELYVLQIVYGLASGVTFPSYMAIFTRHIDKNRENMEWGLRFTLSDVSMALGASVGGFIAYEYGFNAVIILTTVGSIVGAFMLLPIRSYVVHGQHVSKRRK